MPIETVSDSGLDDAASVTAAHWLLRLGGMHQTRLQRHVSCSLAVFLTGMGCAHALELGDAAVSSALGQTLRVEIPYRTSASERIDSSCVSLAQSMNAGDGVPTYTQTSRITVSATHIQVIGDALVREPLIALDVRVQCAGVPHLVRSYLLFVDPPVRTSVALPTQPVTASTTSRVDSVSNPAPVVARSPRPEVSPRARGEDGVRLTQGQTYRVVRGDTLSGIASRIDGRPGNIWSTADEVFEANRQAFTNGNPDLLEEGRSITIPILGGPAQRPVQVTAAETTSVASTEPQLPIASLANDDAAAARDAPPAPTAALGGLVDTVTSDISARVPVAPVAPDAPDAPVVAPATMPRPTPLDLAPAAGVAEATAQPPSASVYSLIAIGVGFMLLLSPLLIVLRRRGSRVDTNRPNVRPETVPDTRPATNVDQGAAAVVGGATPQRSDPQLRPVSIPAPRPAPQPVPVQAAVEDEAEVTVTLSVPSFKDRGDESYSVSEIDHLDLDVGSPVWSKVTEDWSNAQVETVSDDEPTILLAEVAADIEHENERVEASANTASSRFERDTQTMTNMELEMLRQDYETELTLTQQNSQALRDAIADLEATQAMFAASGESPSYEAVERVLNDAPKTRAKSKARSTTPKKPKKRRSPARARSR